MSFTPLYTRKAPLSINARVLLDRAGNPVIDLANNRVAVKEKPKPLYSKG